LTWILNMMGKDWPINYIAGLNYAHLT